MRLHRVILALAALVGSIGFAVPADARLLTVGATTSGADCTLPESDAEALVFLNYYYPNQYVWRDTHLTVAVEAAPNVSEAHIAAARDAIESWSAVLRQCFGDPLTLTDVTGQKGRTADIVVHYVPDFGGVFVSGYAQCGVNNCPNILVSSEFGAPTNESRTPKSFYYLTLHELGHALGLGHATNLRESTDLMGYEWIGNPSGPDPLFSQCDLDAIAYLFGPLLAGEGPAAPGPSKLEQTFDCAGA